MSTGLTHLFLYLFAAPSRDLDLRQQLPSLDESLAEPKYRTPSPANFLGQFLLIYSPMSSFFSVLCNVSVTAVVSVSVFRLYLVFS